MNVLKTKLITVAVCSILVIPVVFAAASPKEVYDNCKKEAASNEISTEDMQGYLRQCMEDAGIEAAEVDKTLKQNSSGNQDDQG